VMEKDEVFDVERETEEVESCYNNIDVTTPKKRKSKTQEDSADKPKKPRSAYLLYYFDVHQMMQQEVPNIPQSEINKRISESWKRLSVAEKAYYLEKAKSEKEGIDSSLSPSKDLPGFRKILPRASYFLFAKGSNHLLGAFQPEVGVESLDCPVDGGMPSISLTQEPQLTPLGLADEVGLPEQPTVVDNVTEETAVASHPMDPRGIPPSSSSSVSSKSPSPLDTHVSQSTADLTASVVTLRGNETSVAALKLASTEPVHRSDDGKTVFSSSVQSVKTYTRRGRGRCPSPWCSFVYVTRHKPPACPECGSHLGGKWIPAVSLNRTYTKNLHWNVHLLKLFSPHISLWRGVLHYYYLQVTLLRDNFTRLKPSTLKQLGQTVPTTTAKQVGTHMCTRTNGNSKDAHLVLTFCTSDLGLSTARGRGRCKNSSCDFMYKNRHKPAVCPKCGCELTQKAPKGSKVKSVTLFDPYQSLSPTQKDVQRQSTLQLLHQSLQIPESETELQETLTLIQELNSLQIVLVQPGDQEQEGTVEAETLVQSGWPRFYESAATHCGLCNYPLFKGGQSTVAGQEDCWLLTETLIQTVSVQLKVCLNIQCLALHCFTDLHPGLFNVGNRLLVSIDLFLKVRAGIRLGQDPSHVARAVLDHVPNHPVHTLNTEEWSQIQELLLSGYWAFECLTVRDYNDMICGICGVAPKLEIAQRCTNNVLELKNVEFTWPEFSVSDEVHVDDFWLTMESEAIEQATFPTDIPITRVDASIVAPFIPPLMRSPTVINTEKDKVLSHSPQPSGDPSVLVRLIHDGQLRLEKIEHYNEEELRTMLEHCGASIDELLASLVSLYSLVHSGLSTAQPPPTHLTAGKLSKVCPHKVVCGSKYLVRGETARDHVDLLLSSRYWPPVYVSDCARLVALCADMQYPELAARMWARNQGCFSDPFEKPVVVSCAGLQDQPYSADLSLVAENQQVHPITKSPCCWLVHPPGAVQEHPASPPEHHSMVLCRDLEPYSTEISNCVRQQPVVFNNPAYYYLYNRLVDFLTSRDIVCQQINQVVQACQPGEVVIRDALCRLGVAQINTEKEDEGSSTKEEMAECQKWLHA
uniref:HMG box domain-containing protein n=1 Tax=Mola mola TaxID=94237 RepID=A0A3Q3W5X9_MOLML